MLKFLTKLPRIRLEWSAAGPAGNDRSGQSTALARLPTDRSGRVSPAPHPADPELQRLMLERLRQLGTAGRLTFLPPLSNLTGETPEMRAAYRQMLGDPYVKSAVFTKILAVGSLDLNVMATDADDSQAKEIAKSGQNGLEAMEGGITGIAWRLLIGALTEGKVLCEKVWGLAEHGKFKGQVVLADLKDKDPYTYRILIDEYLNVTHIEGVRNNYGRIWPVRDFVYYAHAKVYGNPNGMADLRAAYRAWWKLDTIGKLRMLGLDRYTGPFLKGTYPDESLRASLEAALAQARAEGYITLPQGAELEILDLMPRGTSDFESAERDAKEELYTGICGAYLQQMEGATPGGRGNTKVHKSVSELFQWHLVNQAETLINKQILPDLTEFNYGSDAEPPKVALGAIDVNELQAELALDQGLYNMDFPLSRKELADRYSRVIATDPEDILKRPAQPSAAGGPAAPGGAPAVPFDDAPPPAKPPPTKGGGLPVPAAAKSGDVALAGPDGAKARDLLRASQDRLTAKLNDVTAAAVKRLLAKPTAALRATRLFDHGELADLADALHQTLGTADLLGRARVRLRQQQVEGQFADIAGVLSFCMEGENKGMPGPCPEGKADPPGHLSRLAQRAKDLPAALAHKARDYARKKYDALSQRYGSKYAMAIMGAGALGLPLPVPGSSLLLAAPILAIAELHRHLVAHDDAALSFGDADLWTAAGAFMADVVAEWPRESRVESFSDAATDFVGFADSVEPMPFDEALAYFRSLVPSLGTDPKRDGPRLERQAFTAAVNADEVLLSKIKGEIRAALESGKSLPATTKGVQTLLDAAGVSPANPQYSEMVARTNMMDAFNAGSTREMQHPDVAETFPAWKYLGILDGRQGKDHEPKFGRYYPNSAAFADVRGGRVYNCRCSFMPVDRFEWSELQAQGARPETGW